MPDTALTPDRFAEFIAAVHDDEKRTPFPWQQDLVAQLLDESDRLKPWPSSIDAPTGLGKTSVLDAVVYAVAAGGLRLRRACFVVDRRIVVDEAYDHALRLEQRVTRNAAGILGEVGHALAALTGNAPGPAVTATRMRGGITWDWRWMDRPDRFGIVVGTIDQIGSRVLFRGYGLSQRLAPIDAALTGVDAVWFVDEAHLAQPLLDTLSAAQRLDQPDQRVALPAVVVPLSATQRYTTGEPLRFDVAAHLRHREASRRLRAGKALHTVQVRGEFPAIMAAAALAAAPRHQDTRVGVVANTVATARAVFEHIRRTSPRAILLTGRQRPVDRDLLLERDGWADQLIVGWRRRDDRGGPIIVVATQTIEVGANIDFDVLITESAPWDSLVQRVGRLNRVGTHDHRNPAPALVLHHDSKDAHAVYGAPREETWTWISGLAAPVRWANPGAATRGLAGVLASDGVDVSPLALRTLDPPVDTASTPHLTPVLFRQHLDGWVRTGPVPVPDTPVAPFLHGFTDQAEGVRVLWRADLPDLTGDDRADARAWSGTLRLLPPRAGEEIELPLPAVRAWLSRRQPVPVTDDDNAPSPAEPAPDQRRTLTDRPALRIPADEGGHLLIRPGEIRPGDRLVVPASYGGLDPYGWAPKSTTEVVDVADLVDRRRPAVRIDRRTLLPIAARLDPMADPEPMRELFDQLDKDLAIDEELATLPSHVPDHPPTEPGTLATLRSLATMAADLLSHLPGRPPDPNRTLWRIVARPDQGGVRVLLTKGTGRRGSDTTATGSSVSDEPIPLARHHNEVGQLAADIATNLALPAQLVQAVKLAARWHDLGKLDPRFQAWLFGDSNLAEAARLNGHPIAKSGTDPGDRTARRAAHRASAYPERGRHEALSAVLAHHELQTVAQDVDADLVVHLVASHHGWSRPLLPFVLDPQTPHTIEIRPGQHVQIPPDWAVDWQGPRRFHQLGRRYGLWGLALLESIVRLADIACSAGDHTPQESSP